MSTLYEQLGGFTTIRKIVVEFYNNVLDQEELAVFFAKTNMERQIDHQTKFISYLLGGPASYTDDHLKKVHAHMGIEDRHFDMIKDTLEETLEDFDIEDEHIEAILQEFENRRNVVVKV